MTDTRTMDNAQADGWRIIEREAAEQVRVELEAAMNTPLVFGAHIAWVDCMYGRTDALSPIHRVGAPIGSDPFTACGEQIPHPIRRLTINSVFVRTMKRCHFCETAYARAARESAA